MNFHENRLPGWTNEFAEQALHAAVNGLEDPLGNIAAYHFGWQTSTGEPSTSPAGKKLRPIMTIAVAEALGGSVEDALPGALAVDLVHNQSLIHDDIIDADSIRRHRPAVWAAFGTPEAILAGDAVLTLGFQVLLDSPVAARAARHLAESFQYMLRGQMLDLDYEQRSDVTVDDYITMAAAKTGSLFGCAAGLGAICARAREETVQEMNVFGHHVGVAFQLIDDILGIWGTPDAVGKPVSTDVRRRKKSGPVVAALTADNPGGENLRRMYARPEPFSEDEISLVTQLIDKAGGRSQAESISQRYMTLARDALDRLSFVPGSRQSLDKLLNSTEFSIHRTH
ncbi:polyprenyl synthetase family protein [Kribbella antibiotica]|nr:polyprenyl synthetase family protein [Kribbella antibiotica]